MAYILKEQIKFMFFLAKLANTIFDLTFFSESKKFQIKNL